MKKGTEIYLDPQLNIVLSKKWPTNFLFDE